MSVANMTRYYFKFKDNINEVKACGNVVEDESAIAATYEDAIQIMINGYGQRIVKKLVLVKEEPIELYKPAIKLAYPITTFTDVISNATVIEEDNEV
jgi:hypothetical protein